jgi:hypothetical protein
MSRKAPGPLAVAVGAAAATGLMYLVLTVDWSNFAPLTEARSLVAHVATPHVKEPPAPPPAAKSPEDILLNLPCFGCHSRQRFLDETRFSHRVHEAAGHCHVCHAFSSHFEVIVRKEHCGTCHPP